jgi:hypothetical protein
MRSTKMMMKEKEKMRNLKRAVRVMAMMKWLR